MSDTYTFKVIYKNKTETKEYSILGFTLTQAREYADMFRSIWENNASIELSNGVELTKENYILVKYQLEQIQ